MKTFFYTLFILTSSISVNAQFYEFQSFDKTYFESDNWTSVTNGEVWDDPAFEIPLPFDFELYGEVINRIFIMDDGYGAQLGTKATFDEGLVSLIVPLSLDFIDRGYNIGVPVSDIRYTTESTGDNELFIIEWFNVGFYEEISNGASSESYMSFQLLFNRNMNSLEVSFGESNIIDPNTIYEGYGGAAVYLVEDIDNDALTVGETICLVGDPNNPTGYNLDSSSESLQYLVGDIPANKSYLFSISNMVSTSDNIQTDEVILYPSPTTGVIHIDSYHSFSSYKVITTLGRTVFAQDLSANRIDLSNLDGGLYVVELKHMDGSVISKTIVKR